MTSLGGAAMLAEWMSCEGAGSLLHMLLDSVGSASSGSERGIS